MDPTNPRTFLRPGSNSSRPRPGLRRLSSSAATPKDLEKSGPVIVVPPRLMTSNRSKSSQGFAASISQARDELLTKNLETHAEESSSSPTASTPASPRSPITPGENGSADTFAFAFDIDGVLIRGGRPIPEAIEAMRMLNGENEYGIKM